MSDDLAKELATRGSTEVAIRRVLNDRGFTILDALAISVGQLTEAPVSRSR